MYNNSAQIYLQSFKTLGTCTVARRSKDELTQLYNVQSIAGPSVVTQVDSEGEADPYLQAEWCTKDEYTPEEIKQHEKVQHKREEREKKTPPETRTPVHTTGSMGRMKYV